MWKRSAWPGPQTTGNAIYQNQGVFSGEIVKILGKQTAKDWQTGKQDVLWYLWEAEQARNWPVRRGWHEATHFTLPTNLTSADLTEIAPPAR